MTFRKSQFHLQIDSAALPAFLLLVATGFLMAFRLPPGTGGRHGGGGLALLGWSRPDWGGLCCWTSAVLSVLIAVHLVLHWRWVWKMIARHRKAAERGGGGPATLSR